MDIVEELVKSQESFLEQAQNKKCVEKLPAHMSDGTETEDAAQWLAYYNSKKHDALFIIACELLVEQKNDIGTKAKLSHAKININQQRSTKQ